MNETYVLPEYDDGAGFYEIRLKGHLDGRWADLFEGLTITLEESGETLLTSPGIDQAALHGLLKKVRDLGMQLVTVNFINPYRAKNQEIKSKNISEVKFQRNQKLSKNKEKK